MNPLHVTLVLLTAAPCLNAQTVANLDFNFGHGEVINSQYSSSNGINISATGGQNIAIVYDSELGGVDGATIHGADTDLERLSPAGTTGWDGGNLGANYNAGGLLVIQENTALRSPPTYGRGPNQVTSMSNFDPDDNGGGGAISFDIDENNFTYNFFSVTLADFEEGGDDYTTTLIGVLGTTEIYSFADFTNPLHPDYDATITSGDNHINALPEIALSTGEALSQVALRVHIRDGFFSSHFTNLT